MAPRRPPKRITTRYLQAVTARYLEQYATSSSHLRRLLMRRVHRSCEHHGDSVAEKAALVDEEIGRLLRLGYLDDRRYAEDKARALHRRGGGRRKIRAALRGKGLPDTVVDEAIAALSADGGGDPDWAAALTYARKRRIGPWRRHDLDEERRRKELGKLGRAGFSWDIARRIVELPEPPP